MSPPSFSDSEVVNFGDISKPFQSGGSSWKFSLSNLKRVCLIIGKKQILWEILKIGSLEEVWEQTQNHTLELNFSYDTIPHHIFVKGLVRREIMVNIFWSFLKQIECEAKMHPTTNWNVTVCSHSFVGNLIENYFYS